MLIRAITKSKQRYSDQYRVYFYDGKCLTLQTNPDSPQGISQWGEYFAINDATFEEAMENNNQLIMMGNVEVLINFSELPPIIQAHIEHRMEETGK